MNRCENASFPKITQINVLKNIYVDSINLSTLATCIWIGRIVWHSVPERWHKNAYRGDLCHNQVGLSDILILL